MLKPNSVMIRKAAPESTQRRKPEHDNNPEHPKQRDIESRKTKNDTFQIGGHVCIFMHAIPENQALVHSTSFFPEPTFGLLAKSLSPPFRHIKSDSSYWWIGCGEVRAGAQLRIEFFQGHVTKLSHS